MPNTGYVTPSRFKDVLTGGKKGETFGLTAHKYAKEVSLGLIGVEMPEITAKALEHGKEYEPVAVQAYEAEFFVETTAVDEPIFHADPRFYFVCGLPDRLIGAEGLLEIKCPINPINHRDNIVEAKQYYSDYKAQIQGYLWITGRSWFDFVSFNPSFPPHLRLCRHRFQRDNKFIAELEASLLLFWDLVQEKLNELPKVV
jgi:hypothetical protein